MKSQKLLTALTICIILTACASSNQLPNIDPNWKKCIPVDSSQKVIFSDSFIDNSNNWKLQSNSAFLVYITRGVMRFSKSQTNFKNRGCYWMSKAIDSFKTNNDFSISFDAKFVKCKDVFDGIDFEWGDLNNDLYQLSLNKQGQINLKRFTMSKASRWTDISSNVFLELIKEKRFNKIVIQQIDNRCIICINGILVMSAKIEKIAGNKIGVQQCLDVTWDMDNLEIRQ